MHHDDKFMETWTLAQPRFYVTREIYLHFLKM